MGDLPLEMGVTDLTDGDLTFDRIIEVGTMAARRGRWNGRGRSEGSCRILS